MKKLFFLLFTLSYSFSQDSPQLFESWNSFKVDYKISKNFKINYEAQIRLKSQRDLYDQFFNELDFEFNFFKRFSTGFVLRFSEKNDDFGKYTGSKNFLRNQFYIGYNVKKWRYELEFKGKYQIRNKISTNRNYKINIPNKYFRLKIGLKKDFKNWKLDPKIDFEFFLKDKSYSNIYDKYRVSLGTKYVVNKKNSINIVYFYEDDFSYPVKIKGLKLRYNYSLK